VSASPVRVVLLGLGAINTRVVELLHARQSALSIVGVVVRRPQLPPWPSLAGAKRIATPAELAELSPHLVLEAASREAVRVWGEAALAAAKRVVLSSTSALADDDLREKLIAAARRAGSQLVLSPGALAGMDAVSAAGRLNLEEVRHRIVKPPNNWPATSTERAAWSPSEPTVLFGGTAREAARNYPQNANVTVVTALAGLGLDRTRVELVSDPGATGNRHEIQVRGDFGKLDLKIENRPLSSNPKSSELAALALVRLAENEGAGLVL
jgi:aspartate dehydrogenase